MNYHQVVLLILFILIGSSSHLPAQEKDLYGTYQELAKSQIEKKIALFTYNAEQKTRKYKDQLTQYDILDLDTSSFLEIKKASPNILSIPIKSQARTVTLKVYKVEIFSPDYFNETSSGALSGIKKDMIFYRGYVEGFPKSMASLSIVGDNIRMIFSHKTGNHIINKIDDSYILYNDQDLKKDYNMGCDASLLYANPIQIDQKVLDTKNKNTGGCIEVYVETDYQSYLDNGSNVTTTEGWIASLFNEVATLYTAEGIPIVLSSTKIWNSSDPYASISDNSQLLRAFGDQIQNNYTGRLAHLISTRNLGGGIAFVDVLCSNYNASSSSGPYALSGNLSTNITAFPTYSWNVMVFAHEMGHNLGSWHTHDCVWNGNGTQIDDCGNQALSLTSSCYDANNAIIPASNQGTIMSYCHAQNMPGIGFSAGFGSQPRAVITNSFTSASCATGSACGSGASCSDGVQNGDETGIDCGGSLCPNCEAVSNDDCSGALDISSIINGSVQIYANANTNANASNKRPNSTSYSGCNTFQSWCNTQINNDVWYKITIPSGANKTGFLSISTLGSAYDTQIALWQSCTGSLIAANDDYWGSVNNYQSFITAAVNTGQTYYIQVDGYDGSSSGNLSLDIDFTPLTGACSYGSSTISANWEATDQEGWTHYINTTSGKILLSVKKNGNDIGWLGIDNTTCENKSNTGTINLGTNGCNAPYSVNSDWWVMNRTWDLNPSSQPSSSVQVRSYYTTEDFTQIKNANPDIVNHIDLTHYKINGEEDLTLSGNNCHQMVGTNDYTEFVGRESEYSYGTFENDHYAEYSVQSFSGGGGGGGAGAGGALPIQLLYFHAQENEDHNLIKWSTTSEYNNDYQSVLRSADGATDWQEIASVHGHNQQSTIQQYQVIDERPINISYYMLRSVDFDNTTQESEIVRVQRKNVHDLINVYPNPCSDIINVHIDATHDEAFTYEIYSMSGSLVLAYEGQLHRGNNRFPIDMKEWTQGVYQLLIRKNEKTELIRISKI